MRVSGKHSDRGNGDTDNMTKTISSCFKILRVFVSEMFLSASKGLEFSSVINMFQSFSSGIEIENCFSVL